MSTKHINNDNDDNNNNSYFLRQQGLIYDEIDWPPQPSSSTHSTKNNTLHDNNNDDTVVDVVAWRTRDPLTNLLGTDASIIQSETGLTNIELSQLDVTTTTNDPDVNNNNDVGGGSSGHNHPHTVESQFASSQLNIQSNILGPLLPNINGKVVKLAFDAASYAILRGEQKQRASILSTSSASTTAITTSSAKDQNNNNVTTSPSLSNNHHHYDPPLVLAMESIRTSRISNLRDASNVGSLAIPQFLKKNSTIPWFHLPCAVGGTTSVTAPTTALHNNTNSTEGKKGDYKKRPASSGEEEEGDDSKRIKLMQHGEERGDATNNDDDNNAAATTTTSPLSPTAKIGEDDTIMASYRSAKKKKTKKKEKKKGKSTPTDKIRSGGGASTTTPTTSTTTPTSSSGSGKSRKIVRAPSVKLAEEEDNMIANSPTLSRAILSGAAAFVFQELDPNNNKNDKGANGNHSAQASDNVDVDKISKIAGGGGDEAIKINSPPTKKSPTNNNNKTKNNNNLNHMDIVMSRAKRLGNRVLDQSRGAARRGDQRREFRMDDALSKLLDGGEMKHTIPSAHTLPLIVPNPFVVSPGSTDVEDDAPRLDSVVNSAVISSAVKKLDNDTEWTDTCLPRLLDVMSKGTGHAVVHDRQWTDRSLRVANLLKNVAVTSCSSTSTLSSSSKTTREPYPNYGPHLIVTSSGEDFDKFASVFGQLGDGVHSSIFNNQRGGKDDDKNDIVLRALPYHGSTAQRRQLRKHFGSLMPSSESHFSFIGGLHDSPFHVILTTYSVLTEDYAHFCQIPFQVVILDDGMSWLGCSQSDPNGKLGKVWNTGLWSNADFGAGKACLGSKSWDFSKDIVTIDKDDKKSISGSTISEKIDERSNSGKKFPIGLTARHRILLASNMHAQYRGQIYKAPVMGLLTFLTPQFAETIKDDWEKSRIFSCKKSMTYIRTMLARLIVIYSGSSSTSVRTTGSSPNDLIALSLKALDGELPLLHSLPIQNISQEDEGLEKLIKSQKIVNSRKFAVSWFRPFSSIRREIRLMTLDHIISTVKSANAKGFVCEEITTTSSLTPAGSSGSIVGLSAYRPAARCGRCFSSEQGLKLHIASMHAPAGKWLCRSCGGDCGTNQARATHERACNKAPTRISIASPSNTVATAREHNVQSPDGGSNEESIRISGYNGVWKLKRSKKLANGNKYFAKVDGKPVLDIFSDSETLLLFSTAEEAAKKFDEVATQRGTVEKSDLNYNADGSRIVHQDDDVHGNEDVGTSKVARRSAGHNPDIITPDLSVIDIKNLPPHVKPLLRDPNFTPRTGGSTKRYVYAYRGVCRQQRKGCDRWQSQISSNGQNHYLGTFDSEWEAAAVYSWAHLLLYGEEEWKKAAQEGEEAAAAFAQHEKDIAEGKVPTPSPNKRPKKKRGAPKKSPPPSKTANAADSSAASSVNKGKLHEVSKVKKSTPPFGKGSSLLAGGTYQPIHTRKKRPGSQKEWSKLKTECAMMLSSGTKGTSKATILATRKDIADMSETKLLQNVSNYASGRLLSVSKTFLQTNQSTSVQKKNLNHPLRSCTAVLIGLTASDFGWEMQKFINTCQNTLGAQNEAILRVKLTTEFGSTGVNRSFCAFVLSSSFTLGRVSKAACQNSFLIPPRPASLATSTSTSTLGMSVGGNVDCDIGGPTHSCSELAAMIEYLPSKYGNFQFMACNDDDIVTLNGQQVTAGTGPLPLRDRDVCSVGARVFVFIENIIASNH